MHTPTCIKWGEGPGYQRAEHVRNILIPIWRYFCDKIFIQITYTICFLQRPHAWLHSFYTAPSHLRLPSTNKVVTKLKQLCNNLVMLLPPPRQMSDFIITLARMGGGYSTLFVCVSVCLLTPISCLNSFILKSK